MSKPSTSEALAFRESVKSIIKSEATRQGEGKFSDADIAEFNAALNLSSNYEELTQKILSQLQLEDEITYSAELIFAALKGHFAAQADDELKVVEGILKRGYLCGNDDLLALVAHSKSVAAISSKSIGNLKAKNNIDKDAIKKFLTDIRPCQIDDKITIAKEIIKWIFLDYICNSDSETDSEENTKDFNQSKQLFAYLLNNFCYSNSDRESKPYKTERLELIRIWIVSNIAEITIEQISEYGQDDSVVNLLICEKIKYLERDEDSKYALLFLRNESSPPSRDTKKRYFDYFTKKRVELKGKIMAILEGELPTTISVLAELDSFSLQEESLEARKEILINRAIISIYQNPATVFTLRDATTEVLDLLYKRLCIDLDVATNFRSKLLQSWTPLQSDTKFGDIALLFDKILTESVGKPYYDYILKTSRVFLDHLTRYISENKIDFATSGIESAINLHHIFPDEVDGIIKILSSSLTKVDVNDDKISNLHYFLRIVDKYAETRVSTKSTLPSTELLEEFFTKISQLETSEYLIEEIDHSHISRIFALPSNFNAEKVSAAMHLCTLAMEPEYVTELFLEAVHEIDDYEKKSDFIVFFIRSGHIINRTTNIDGVIKILSGLKISEPRIIEMADRIYGLRAEEEFTKSDFFMSCFNSYTLTQKNKLVLAALQESLSHFINDSQFFQCLEKAKYCLTLTRSEYASFLKARAKKQFKTLCGIFNDDVISEKDINALNFQHHFLPYLGDINPQSFPIIDFLIILEIINTAQRSNRSPTKSLLYFLTPESATIISDKISSTLRRSVLLRAIESSYLLPVVFTSHLTLQRFATDLGLNVGNCMERLYQKPIQELADLDIDFSEPVEDLDEEKPKVERFTEKGKKDINLLFKKILRDLNPNPDEVSEFFLKILSNLEGQDDLTLSTEKKEKMLAFFNGYKRPLAFLLSSQNGLNQFCSKIMPATSDGCFANIGSQISTLFNSIFIKDPKTLLLYRFFQEKIVTKISYDGFDLTHGDLFTHPTLSNFVISVEGFIHEFIQYLKSDKGLINKSQFITDILGEEMYTLLLSVPTIQGDEEKELFELNLVTFFAMQSIESFQSFTDYLRLKSSCEEVLSLAKTIRDNPKALADACIERISPMELGESVTKGLLTSEAYDVFLGTICKGMSSSGLLQAAAMMIEKAEIKKIDEERREKERAIMEERRERQKRVRDEEEGVRESQSTTQHHPADSEPVDKTDGHQSKRERTGDVPPSDRPESPSALNLNQTMELKTL